MSALTENDKYFINTFRLVLDTLQIAKYNLGAFKESSVHKTVPGQKDLRPDIVKLHNAINAFLMSSRNKCSPETFGLLLRDMSRDKLHDLSLHMEFMYKFDNVAEITEALRVEMQVVVTEEEK